MSLAYTGGQADVPNRTRRRMEIFFYVKPFDTCRDDTADIGRVVISIYFVFRRRLLLFIIIFINETGGQRQSAGR